MIRRSDDLVQKLYKDDRTIQDRREESNLIKNYCFRKYHVGAYRKGRFSR